VLFYLGATASEDCENTTAQTVEANFEAAMIFANHSSEIHFLRGIIYSCEFNFNLLLYR
jgi:hypothetical protein